jgi:hypothetical protein
MFPVGGVSTESPSLSKYPETSRKPLACVLRTEMLPVRDNCLVPRGQDAGYPRWVSPRYRRTHRWIDCPSAPDGDGASVIKDAKSVRTIKLHVRQP